MTDESEYEWCHLSLTKLTTQNLHLQSYTYSAEKYVFRTSLGYDWVMSHD